MQIVVAGGVLYTKLPEATVLTSRTTPAGVTLKAPRPCFTQLRRATIINGRYSPAVTYRDDLDTFYKTGLTTPTVGPILNNTGASAGKLTGQSIGYYTWVQMAGTVRIAESGPSAASGEGVPLTSTKAKRLWTLPTTAPDARVTHKAIYVSWNGAAPRHVQDVALATASVTEDTPALNLGRLMEEDGTIPPYGVFNETNHQRVWYAGIPEHPDRIYFSNFGDAEAVGEDNYLLTTSGQAVTGIKKLGETTVVFTANTTDVIYGNTPSTFAILPRDPTIGCISHHGIINMFNRLWFPSQDGMRTYNGGFTYVMESLRDFWRDDYKANPSAYENCFAGVDFDFHCYLLTLDKATTFRYAGYYLPYEPAVGGGENQPWWFIDKRSRKDTAMGRLTYITGTARTKLITGSGDGFLREEGVMTNRDDDGDVLLKALIIQPKHYMFNDPGGFGDGGKNLVKLHSYVESEETPWALKVYGGDESAINSMAEQWGKTVPASLKTEDDAGVTKTYTAVTVHNHNGVEKASGRGFTFVYTASEPKNFYWRGLGGTWTLGSVSRPRSS